MKDGWKKAQSDRKWNIFLTGNRNVLTGNGIILTGNRTILTGNRIILTGNGNMWTGNGNCLRLFGGFLVGMIVHWANYLPILKSNLSLRLPLFEFNW